MGKERVRCEVERKEKCDGWRCQIRAALAASAASGDSLAVNTRLLAIIAMAVVDIAEGVGVPYIGHSHALGGYAADAVEEE